MTKYDLRLSISLEIVPVNWWNDFTHGEGCESAGASTVEEARPVGLFDGRFARVGGVGCRGQ